MRDAPTGTHDAPRLLPVLGWLTAALFFGYAWVLRVAPSVMVEELMRDFAVGAGGARQPLGGLLLRLCRHADPGRRAARPLRPAPPDHHLHPSLRRRLRAVRHRRHAGDRHRRPLPDRRLGRLQPGRGHGRCRPVVQPRPLRHALGAGDGDGHGRRRARAGAAARRRRGFRLAHDHAAAGRRRRGAVCWPPGRPCATGGAAAAASPTCCRASASSRAIRRPG